MNLPKHKAISPISMALALLLTLGLCGCGSSRYHFGPPPADSVTFPSASSQGWLVQFGTPASTNPYRSGDSTAGVATDFQGNVIVLDQTYGAFPGFTNSNNQSQFAIVKFDSGGHQVWVQQLGTGFGDVPYAIATDTQGNILVGGSTRGAFPGFVNGSGGRQSVVIKLNPSGQVLWIQQFSSAINTFGNVTSLATDSQSNIIVGGHYNDSLNNLYGYVMKLAPADGTVLWKQNGGSLLDVSSVAADPQNNIVAVGDFGSAGNASSIYMAAKLNGASGQTLWQQLPVTFAKFGAQNLIYTSAALDAQGNIFAGGLNQSSGYGQCVVAKLANDTGAQQWQQQFGAAQACIPGSIATDTAGNVLMSGGNQSPFFSGSNPPKTDDVFLAKLNPGGTAVWLQQFGTGKDGAQNSSLLNALIFVATDTSNHAYVAGTTFGAFPGYTNSAQASQVFVTQFGQ